MADKVMKRVGIRQVDGGVVLVQHETLVFDEATGQNTMHRNDETGFGGGTYAEAVDKAMTFAANFMKAEVPQASTEVE